MGILGWLGINEREKYIHLDALYAKVREVLESHEPVVLRYVTMVVALLSKVARADGNLDAEEELTLRKLMMQVGTLDEAKAQAVCDVVRQGTTVLTDQELVMCVRELKSICDRGERIQVLRLLVQLASSDSTLVAAEHETLLEIAELLGLASDDLAQVEGDWATRLASGSSEPSRASDASKATLIR